MTGFTSTTIVARNTFTNTTTTFIGTDIDLTFDFFGDIIGASGTITGLETRDASGTLVAEVTDLNWSTEAFVTAVVDLLDFEDEAGIIPLFLSQNFTIDATAVTTPMSELDTTGITSNIAYLSSNVGDFFLSEEGNDSIVGGTGFDSIHGGDGNDTILGGSGNDNIGGAVGDDRITAGPGDDTVRGAAGADTFVFEDGDDTLLVEDFSFAENDRLELDAAIWGTSLTATQVISTFGMVVGGNTVLDFGDGDVITLQGITDMTTLAGFIDIV